MEDQKNKVVTVTVLGVTAEASVDALDDYDLFEVIMEHGASSAASVIAVGKALFGENGWKDVTDALRDENGKLKLSRVSEFVNTASEQIDALKN